MQESDFLTWVGQYGFPMALAVYLLLHTSREIADLKQSVNRLADEISALWRPPSGKRSS